MAPPLPIGRARERARFVGAVRHHNVAEDAEKRQVGGLVALRPPGGAVSLGQRLDARVGDERDDIALQARCVGRAPWLDRREPERRVGCCNGRASMRTFLQR